MFSLVCFLVQEQLAVYVGEENNVAGLDNKM